MFLVNTAACRVRPEEVFGDKEQGNENEKEAWNEKGEEEEEEEKEKKVGS